MGGSNPPGAPNTRVDMLHIRFKIYGLYDESERKYNRTRTVPKLSKLINQVIGEFTSGAEVYNDMFKERKKVLYFLQNVNKELEGTPFKIAYRVRDEFLIYCYHASQNNSNTNWLTEALDEMTSMKILSRIEGDENKTQHVLVNLLKIITSDYKKSHSKLLEMLKRLQSSGYTSFWS